MSKNAKVLTVVWVLSQAMLSLIAVAFFEVPPYKAGAGAFTIYWFAPMCTLALFQICGYTHTLRLSLARVRK
jgi:hypothetical protein